jgi:hypothetical protein
MPTITFNGNPIEALALSDLTLRMKGPGNFYPHRQAVRDRVVATWPELKNGIKDGDSMLSEKRGIDISPEEQTALSEGMLAVCRGDEITDVERARVFALARLCRFEPWLQRQLAKGEVKAFTGSDEDVNGGFDEETASGDSDT